MSTGEITARLARLGRVDPAEFFNEDGSYKKIRDMSPAARFCIRGWEDELRFDADGAPPTMTRKVKIADPHPPLRTLAQIEGLIKNETATLNAFFGLADRLDAARKRSKQRELEEAPPPPSNVVSEQ
jgi:hypothetical protein